MTMWESAGRLTSRAATAVAAIAVLLAGPVACSGNDDGEAYPPQDVATTQSRPSARASKTPVRKTTPPVRTTGAAAVTFPLRLTVDEVASFSQLRGQTQWTPQDRARMAGSRWVFNASGSFTVSADANLFPLTGKFTRSGSTLTFRATGYRANAGGTSFAEVGGTITVTRTASTLRGHWASGATYGARVNEQDFASSAQALYEFELEMTD